MACRKTVVSVHFILLLWVAFCSVTLADVTLFGCQRLQDLSSSEVDDIFEGTCDALTQTAVDFTQFDSNIVDGSTFLTDSDEECCSLCRKTSGCRSWTRFDQSDGAGRPGDGCWLTTSKVLDTDRIQSSDAAHSGTLLPAVANPITCPEFEGIGIAFDDQEYNEPKLLQVESPEECCRHCQEQAPLCRSWMVDEKNMYCKLFSHRPFRQKLCETCRTGTIRPGEDFTDEVQQIIDESCERTSVSGNEGSIYRGTPITDSSAFDASTSTDCCTFCAMIRECKTWTWLASSSECRLFGDIPATTEPGERLDSCGAVVPKVCGSIDFKINEGVSLSPDTTTTSNSPSRFPAVDPPQCGLRCQEEPSCRAWTYFSAKSECSIVHQPLVVVRECDECLAATMDARYATPDDQELLKEIENEIASLESPGRPSGSSSVETASETGPGGSSEPSGDSSDDDKSKLVIIIVVVCIVVLLLALFPVFIQYKTYKRKRTINDARKATNWSQSLAQTSSLLQEPDSEEPTGGGHVQPGMFRGKLNQTESLESSGSLTYDPTGSLTYDPSIPVQEKIQLPSDQSELLQDILKGSRQKGSFFEFRSQASMRIHEDNPLDAVLQLESGTTVAYKYEIEPGTRIGQNAAIVKARAKIGRATPVVLKFFRSKEEFDREYSFYADSSSSSFLPAVLDVYDGQTNEALGLPPFCCIVLERGDMSLQDMLAEQTVVLDHMNQRNLLYKIVMALQFLHERRIIHRDLKPGNIVVFSSNLFTIKLIDLGSACKQGEDAPIEYTLRYAAPEVVSLHLKGAPLINAHPSSDMWALGLIFWEVLVGEPLFGQKYTEEEVMAMLLGISPLPFERVPQMWNRISDRIARRVVQSLLQKEPEARWPIQKVASNAFFYSGHDTVSQEAQVEAFGNKLQEIAEGVMQIKQSLIKLEDISIENLKLNASQALLACISFLEIDNAAFTQEMLSSQYIVGLYQNQPSSFVEAPLEPSYNIFVQKKEDPITLLRLSRRHLIRISMMTAGDVKVDVPISEILWIKIWPTEMEQDALQSQFYLIKSEGHVMEGVAYWDTLQHRDLTLKLSGRASVDVTIAFRLRGQPEITVVQKTVQVRMNPETAKFRTLRVYNRTRNFYNNLPPWARIYIHGTIAIAKFVSA